MSDFTQFALIDSDNEFRKKNTFNVTNVNGYLQIVRGVQHVLNYDGTNASLVIQHEDYSDLPYNGIRPGTITSFWNEGNGWVNGPAEQSMSISAGHYTYVSKKGNGSAHGYTVGGQLLDCQVYNELGGFQVNLTNNGSNLGYMSLFEGLASDTPNGVNSFSTKMVGIGLRINKSNPTSRFSTHILLSSEGPYPVTGIMINPQGLQRFSSILDMRNANITTGQAIIWKNNTSLAWQCSNGSISPTLWINNADNVYLAAPALGGAINLTGPDFYPKFRVDTNQNVGDACWLWAGGKLRRVGVGAPNSAGNGFRVLVVAND